MPPLPLMYPSLKVERRKMATSLLMHRVRKVGEEHKYPTQWRHWPYQAHKNVLYAK